MSSLSSILNTAASALSTYQAAINVTGQNIANADNPDYSIQSPNLATTAPVNTGGHIYGTGVDVDAITQAVNQTVENQLTGELSTKAALDEEVIYTNLIEDLFAEGSENKDSLNILMDNYWGAWEDLSNNPYGDTDQEQVYRTGLDLALRMNAISSELDGLEDDLNRDIASGVGQINVLTDELAGLNQAILSGESAGGSANDLRDRRNTLVDELGGLIDIDVITKSDGSYLINTTGGLPLVSDGLSYSLDMVDDRVYWSGSGASGNRYDITDHISGGKLGGWLNVRDEALPETRAELDELSSMLIWTMNYQHSQGAGQSYYTDRIEGTYAVDGSGTLDSLNYGDRIDYTKDFTMVVKDSSSADASHQTVNVDMGISQAEVSDLEGQGQADCTYEFTVVDEGVLGDQIVAQTGGDALGGISTAAPGNVSDALDTALADQTLTITGGHGTEEIRIGDSGADARRSAADIAEELNNIDGVEAYASPTEVTFGLNGITEAQDGDIIRFTLYVDGQEQVAAFTVDSTAGTLEDQFEACLKSAADSINQARQNTDLRVDGRTLSSASGATIGIQEVGIIDNAGIALDGFSDFNAGDLVTLTVATSGASSVATTVTVDLTGVDTTDAAAMAQAFYDAMDDQLTDTPFTVQLDTGTNQVILRTTDGADISLSAASGDTGNDAHLSVAALNGSTVTGGGQLDFDGADLAGATANTVAGDYLVFSLPGCGQSGIGSAAARVGEPGSGHDASAVLTGSVTLVLNPGMEVTSDNTTGAGLFGAAGGSGNGNSVITLGGTGGYGGFDDGDDIVFEVDGHNVAYTLASSAGVLTDAEQAKQLYDALVAGLPADGYEVILNGASVTIVRTAEGDDPLAVTGFSDITGQDASLAVSTGTGAGSTAPDNQTLVSGDPVKGSAVAVTRGDPATMYWEVFDSHGQPTGESGFVEIDGPGTVELTESGGPTLSFEVTEGSLVAGNTMRVNTNANGEPDPLDFSVAGTAASIDDTYSFTVASGGTLPSNGEPVVIEWTSQTSSGTIALEGNDPPDPNAPLSAQVDGMTLSFNQGTLVAGDVFYVSVDDGGRAVTANGADTGTGTSLCDWHWTLDSFADEFNRSAGGVTASVTGDNTLAFDTNPDYCAVENLTCSGAHGISEENMTLAVLDYSALDITADDLRFTRENGAWKIENDPTGGTLQMIPPGGDDNGFMVDLDGDGLGDIEVVFDQAVTGDGTIQMDFAARDSHDIGFAFAGGRDGDSGLMAALGINTFFTGTDAGNMGVNGLMADGNHIASGMVNPDTGEISAGDKANNALSMADTRYDSLTMKQWTYSRGEPPRASLSETSLDEYEHTLIASVGFKSRSAQSSLDYSERIVYQFTNQRDAISAVSLDEEMIRLTAQQQAYEAASMLLNAVDEMFDALLSLR